MVVTLDLEHSWVKIYQKIDHLFGVAMETVGTKNTIMAEARKIVQARGYSSLSFRDLAGAVGVKSSSVHYHFPTKGDLAAAIANQYANEASAGFDEVIESGANVKTCMKHYIKRWRAALEDSNRMCLCAIMAAEYDLLPLAVKKEVDRFTDIHVRWLEKVLSLETKNLTKHGLKKRATAIFAAFQGAQLMARSRADISLYDETVKDYRAAGLFP